MAGVEGMATQSTPWTLTIPSDLRLLPLARSFLEAVCKVAGLDETVTNAVVLAADEATNNIIRHAHRGHPEFLLQVQCFFEPDHIEIQLHDEGEPFDLTAVPHMDPGELRVGGRGVFLMRRLMDELEVVPRTGRGNTLRMVKRCRPAIANTAPP
jgi:serine/threonine-protein kinase RsbW